VIIFLADVKLASDDRFNANLVRGIHKVHRAKDVSMVGHGHGRHAQFVNAMDEFVDVASAVEQRIIAMQMQMDELILAHEVTSGSISPRRMSVSYHGMPSGIPQMP
jgi:hypothetical protein